MKFPEEAELSAEAKDLISRLLCNVANRLGTKGAHEIKVSILQIPLFLLMQYIGNVSALKILWFVVIRHTHGSRAPNGKTYIRWKLLLYQRSMTS